MKKRVIALFTLVVVTISAYSQALSQSRCNLTATNSPSVRGLRLGMSTQELLTLFPALPSRSSVPSPGVFALIRNGNSLMYERSLASMLTSW